MYGWQEPAGKGESASQLPRSEAMVLFSSQASDFLTFHRYSRLLRQRFPWNFGTALAKSGLSWVGVTSTTLTKK